MNKKGFTLIELLAVIVILAIIAVITVPRIADMIEMSRKGSANDSFYGFIHASELAYTKELQNNPNLKDETCTIPNSVITYTNGTDIKLSGENPKSGIVTITSGGSAMGTNLKFNNYICSGNLNTKKPCEKQNSENNNLAANKLKENVVTSGEGLYKDPVEVDRYVYRGANPNNYIWLDLNGNATKTDNEIYRIVAVESDNTIKVISEKELTFMYWDSASNYESRYSNISTDYCNSNYGCKIWGSKTTMLDSNGNNITQMPRKVSGELYDLPDKESSLNIYLNTTFLKKIDSKLNNNIVVHSYDVGLLLKGEEQTLVTDVLQEKAYKWKGKIALINATDYVKASINSACTSTYDYVNTSECYKNSNNHNYLYNSTHATYQWTLSPVSGSTTEVCVIAGSLSNYTVGYYSWSIFPTFYLASDVVLKGSGTIEQPYTIE